MDPTSVDLGDNAPEAPAALEQPSGSAAYPSTVTIEPHGMRTADVVAIARYSARVELGEAALEAMAASRRQVEDLAGAETPAYGISTGFGALATRHIPEELRSQLQRSLVRSHAAGVGDPVETEVVRALMTLRLKTLASGHTGARPVVATTLAAMLNAGVTPAVREYGSLGCSGDLAPLAHVALALIGEGEAEYDGELRPVAEAFGAAGIVPIQLAAKEGLALINGTDGMLGMLVLACLDLEHLLDVVDVTAAMSVEATLGTDRAFASDLQRLRPHPGQARSAARMHRMLADSAIVASHRENCPRVQDAYSLRCSPQVHGAARDTLEHARVVSDRELVAAIDNPVVLSDGRVESNGNFHGAPLAYVLDFLAVAVADVGSMAERRTDRLLDHNRSHGLPAFLADDPGVDSGLMIAQYAQASLVAENKRLAVPASTDSIPSSAMQEDHVSMGWNAARKLRVAVANLTRVAAIELLTAARALELRAPLTPAPATAAVLAVVRSTTGGTGPDRYLSPQLRAAEDLIRSGRITATAESVTGRLPSG